MSHDPHQIVILPAPPRVPAEGWTADYGNQMNRWLQSLSLQLAGISYLRGSALYLSPESMHTSGYGLKPGEVFANAGILTMVRADDIWAGSFEITGEVGTLTVTV